jgi:hypothetical protein
LIKKYLFLVCIFLVAIFAVLDFDLDIAADKFAHIKISLLLFILITAIRLTFRRHMSEAVVLVLSLRDVLVIGLLKELFDGAFGTGVPELADIFADLIGILIPFFGLLIAEFFGVGYESFVHDGRGLHSGEVVAREGNYFRRQWVALRHAGVRLIWQI